MESQIYPLQPSASSRNGRRQLQPTETALSVNFLVEPAMFGGETGTPKCLTPEGFTSFTAVLDEFFDVESLDR